MWKRLTTDDLRQALAEDEIQNLNTMSVSEDLDGILQQQLDCISESFRGAFRAKGYHIDIRDHYTPASYTMYILALARYWCWTRFPQSSAIALDEPRKKLFESAQDILKDPYIAVEKPEWAYDDHNPENMSSPQTGSVVLPYLRFDEQLYWWSEVLSAR